jgi:uncharacterized protein
MTPSLIAAVAADVRRRMEGEGSGHDWWHIERVWRMGKRLAEAEGANSLVVELACLCHDLADWKFADGDEQASGRATRDLLADHGVAEDVIRHVVEIVDTISYKGAGVANKVRTLEGMVMQDADRLDAIGAVGIARAFAYGGHANRIFHDPDDRPVLHQTKEAYMQAKGTTINHFYEKLLLLKDRMNTATAKEIAADRHVFMEEFLEEFFLEWDGQR